MYDNSKGKMHDSSNRNQSGNQRKGYYEKTEKSDTVQKWRDDNVFTKEWIISIVDSEMVKFTESAGKFMAKNGLTNSKIRSIYGEIKRIQMGKYEEEKAAFLLLRPKVAYALGRDSYNNGLALFKQIFDEAANHVTDQKSFNNFCDFFEAILAYHKAFGGKD